jgi:two-component system response regulator DegU
MEFPIRVALVDEAQDFREALRLTLEKQRGFHVIAEAGDGQSAVELVERHQPDVLVMALAMPVMNGLDATKMIVPRYPETKVIILTKYASKDNHSQAMMAGACDLITKNCAMKEVYRSILSCCYGSKRPEC